jgi:hypothetical protein
MLANERGADGAPQGGQMLDSVHSSPSELLLASTDAMVAAAAGDLVLVVFLTRICRESP